MEGYGSQNFENSCNEFYHNLDQSGPLPPQKLIKNAIFAAYLSPIGSVTQEVASSSLVGTSKSAVSATR